MNLQLRPKMQVYAPNFTNVAAGQTAVCKPVLGNAQFNWLLELSDGLTLADLNEIRVYVNNQIVRTFKTGAELDNYNQYMGLNAESADNILPLYFARQRMKDRVAQEATVLGTGVQGTDPHTGMPLAPYNLRIEVDIDAAAAITGTGLKMLVTQGPPMKAGATIWTYQNAYPAAVAGENYIQDMFVNKLLSRIWLQSADITRCQLKLNNTVVYDRTKAEANRAILDGGIFDPSKLTGFIIDFEAEGWGDELLSTHGYQSVILKFWASPAPGTVPVVYETIEPAIQQA